MISDFAAIDYFQFDFTELELHNSWKVVHSGSINKCFIPHSTDIARLENLSWRKWTKLKYNLEEVSPAMVDWNKECDITWLYGPLVRSDGNSECFGFESSPAHLTNVRRSTSVCSISSTSSVDSLPLYSDVSDEESLDGDDDNDSGFIKPILKHRYTHGPFGLEDLRRSNQSIDSTRKFRKSVSFSDMVDIRQF